MGVVPLFGATVVPLNGAMVVPLFGATVVPFNGAMASYHTMPCLLGRSTVITAHESRSANKSSDNSSYWCISAQLFISIFICYCNNLCISNSVSTFQRLHVD